MARTGDGVCQGFFLPLHQVLAIGKQLVAVFSQLRFDFMFGPLILGVLCSFLLKFFQLLQQAFVFFDVFQDHCLSAFTQQFADFL